MRLALYSDLLYFRDGDAISSHTAFVYWIAALAGEVDELVLFGRLHPAASRATHLLTGDNIRFIALPFYPTVRDVSKVIAAAPRSLKRWREATRGCDVVLVFGPHPLGDLLACSTRLVGSARLVVGAREQFSEYASLRISRLQRRVYLPMMVPMEHLHRWLGGRGGAIAVGDRLARWYGMRVHDVLQTGVSLISRQDVVSAEVAKARSWPGEHRILVVSRLDPDKNPLLCLDVAECMRAQGPWSMSIAGTGLLEARMRKEIEARGLEDVVSLLGRVERERLKDLYRESTVFLHASRTEGQPQVLYEAAAAGIPIVATDVGGVAAALAHGERGMLVAPDDAGAVLAALAHLASDSDHRTEMVLAARRWAEAETRESQVANVAAFLRALAA